MCCKEILNASKLFTRGDFFNWKANSNARSFRILAALKWRGLCICRFVFELLAANGLLVWLLMLNGVLVLCSRQLCVIALRCLAAFLDLYVICFLFVFCLFSIWNVFLWSCFVSSFFWQSNYAFLCEWGNWKQFLIFLKLKNILSVNKNL